METNHQLRRRLSELVTPRREKIAGTKNQSRRYVGLEHMAPGAPELLGSAEATSSISTNAVFEPGDVLFGKLRPNLRKSVLAAFPGYCSTDILVLRPREGADPSFVAKVFQSEPVVRRAVATAIGTKMPRTSWAELRELEVFCPEPTDQRRVAEILSVLDEVLRTTGQSIAKLERIWQGALQDLLTRGIDDDGVERDEEANRGQFADSALGRIPASWAVEPFETFARADRPFLKTGPFGSSLKGEHWVERGTPVITIGALGEGEFLESELLFVGAATAERLAAYAVEAGDIVFSRVADVGRSVVVEADQQGWIMSSNLMWISLDPHQVDPYYVWLNLSGNFAVRRQVRRLVNAGGREVANGAVLRSLRLPWPPLEEQQRIVAAARSIRHELRRERELQRKFEQIKAGLMEDLLSGRLRVPPREEVLV